MNEFAIKVISGLLSAFFIFTSSIKILGWQKMIFEKQLELFIKYGLNRTLMALIGCIELFGAIALWLPSYFGICGALALFCTSAGAIFYHLRFDTWKDGIPAMITLVLSGIVVIEKYNVLSASFT
jgi:DoxX-like family